MNYDASSEGIKRKLVKEYKESEVGNNSNRNQSGEPGYNKERSEGILGESASSQFKHGVNACAYAFGFLGCYPCLPSY